MSSWLGVPVLCACERKGGIRLVDQQNIEWMDKIRTAYSRSYVPVR